MKYSIALTALALSQPVLSSTLRNAADSRRLSYEQIFTYEPGSQVTDHAAIDLDQASIETQLGIGTDASFAKAREIYENGGHSKSHALVTLDSALGVSVAKGTTITGVTETGASVTGKAYSSYEPTTSQIKVQYITSDVQDTYVSCKVGALPLEEQVLGGCLAATGTLKIGSDSFNYSYDPATDNDNGRTIQGFSTAAEDKMFNCGGRNCPYEPYKQFYDYYGEFDYANQWVLAAFEGKSTTFANGNADFSRYGITGKKEVIKKGTAYMNIYMYVIREFYDAIDDCQIGCINCNDDPVHAWDEGVAFYTGSMESKLLYTLAQKRCANYNTCGFLDELSDEGTARVNYDLFAEFNQGKYSLLTGNCAAAQENVDRIVDLMAIPLIQGTLRYAYKVDKLQGMEKEKAEGAVFAAAVLPKVHACNPDDASTIYNHMKVGASRTKYEDVKAAFENNYECLGITCGDIGGLLSGAESNYYEGAEPCESKTKKTSSSNVLAISLGSAGAAIGVICLVFAGILISKEKSGKPMFEETKNGLA